MNNKSHISYEQLLKIISWKIFTREIVNNQCDCSNLPSIKGAVYEGKYIGSPGKDIYFMLPYLSEEQMKEIAIIMKNSFPKIPPKSYSHTSACIRFIYGQFEKQGILKSEKDFDRMKKENNDWELSRKFLGLLYKELENDNNYYGLSILCEMEGHRLGDESILNNDKIKLNLMIHYYEESVKFAKKCMGYKHFFSSYYWAAKYLIKFGDKEQALKYAKLSIINANKFYYKYFPKGENYYKERLSDIFKYIKENDLKGEVDFLNKYKNFLKRKK